MKHIYTIIIVALTFNSYSQEPNGQLIVLDTIIGERISLNELKKYYIFEFIDTTNYDHSQVYRLNDSTYLLKIHYSNKNINETELSKSEVENARENIYYMKGYYSALNKQNKSIPLNTYSLKDIIAQNYPFILYAHLYVKKTKKTKMEIMEGKQYYFKFKDKFESRIPENYIGSNEKYAGFIQAEVQEIMFNDSSLLLKKNNSELVVVKFNEIAIIKINTGFSVFLKSKAPGKRILTIPLLIYNLIFNMKKFDLANDSKFIVVK